MGYIKLDNLLPMCLELGMLRSGECGAGEEFFRLCLLVYEKKVLPLRLLRLLRTITDNKLPELQ